MPELLYDIHMVDTVANTLIKAGASCSVFTFTGTLGAGKTTLIQAMLRAYDVTDLITSPTFTYVNVYHNAHGIIFYHFDCYRIQSLDEFINAGFAEYLYAPNSIAFIEWPTIIMPLLTSHVCHINLEYHGNDMRHLECTINP